MYSEFRLTVTCTFYKNVTKDFQDNNVKYTFMRYEKYLKHTHHKVKYIFVNNFYMLMTD